MTKATAATAAQRPAAFERFAPLVASALAGLAMMSIAAVVAGAVDHAELSMHGARADFLEGAVGLSSFWPLVVKNLGVAALMYSDVATTGIGTILGMPLVAIGIGGFAGAGAATHGWDAMVSSTLLYAPIEFAGIAVAGGAGILPLLAAVAPSLQAGSGPLDRYIRAMARTLRLAALAFGLLVLGATIESAVIASR